MALENAGFPVIFNQFPTETVDANDIALIYKPSTGQVHGILGSNAFTAVTDSSDFTYSSTQTYGLNDVAIFDNRWWRSLQANNTGNIPQTGSAFWVQLNTVSEIAIPDWEAGLYLSRAVVFVGTTLYRIQSGTALPFNSTVSPDMDATNWESSSGGITAQNVQNSAFSFAVDTGVANGILVALTPALTSYQQGQRFYAKIAENNTGATTVNVNGLGTISVVDILGNALGGGAILADSIYEFFINEVSVGNFQAQISIDVNVDNRPDRAALSDFNTNTTIDGSLAKVLTIALTADRAVGSIQNLTDPVLIVCSGNQKLTWALSNVTVVGNTNYNNPIVRLSFAAPGFPSRIIAEYLDDPKNIVEQVTLSTTTVDMGENSNNVLIRTGTGNENITITNPMLNGIFTIRHTGATTLTVEGDAPLGGYDGTRVNIIDVRCTQITPSVEYSVLNEIRP